MDRRLRELMRRYQRFGPVEGYQYYQMLRRSGNADYFFDENPDLFTSDTAVYNLGRNLGVAAIPILEEIIERYLEQDDNGAIQVGVYRQAIRSIGNIAREYESGSKGDGPPVYGTGYTNRREYLIQPGSELGLPILLHLLELNMYGTEDVIRAIRLLGQPEAVPALNNYVAAFFYSLENPPPFPQSRPSFEIVRAIEALAFFRDPRSIPTLIFALGHHVTREAAAEALGYIEPTTPEVIEELHQTIEQHRSRGAAWSLGRIGNSTSIPVLIDLFFNAGEYRARNAAIRALGQLNAFEELMAIISDEEVPINLRIDAISGLSATCDEVIEGAPGSSGRTTRAPVPGLRGGRTDPEQVAHALIDIFNSDEPLMFRKFGLIHLRDICIPWVTEFLQDVAQNPASYAADSTLQQEAQRLVEWHDRNCNY